MKFLNNIDDVLSQLNTYNDNFIQFYMCLVYNIKTFILCISIKIFILTSHNFAFFMIFFSSPIEKKAHNLCFFQLDVILIYNFLYLKREKKIHI